MSEAQLASAKANLQLARLNLSYTKVFAPIEGYVTKNASCHPMQMRI